MRGVVHFSVRLEFAGLLVQRKEGLARLDPASSCSAFRVVERCDFWDSKGFASNRKPLRLLPT